jgi:hypothetical protein
MRTRNQPLNPLIKTRSRRWSFLRQKQNDHYY